MALMTPFVQTRLVDYFTRILEERTGTTISIGRVEFRPIESLILNDVFGIVDRIRLCFASG